MKTVLQRFISEFEKEDVSEGDLIKMADIVAKIWSSRAEKEVLVDELLNDPQRVPDTDGEYQDPTNEQLTEAYHIQSNMRTFHFGVQRMYRDYEATGFAKIVFDELAEKLDKDPKELSEMPLGDLLKLVVKSTDDLDDIEEHDDEFDDPEVLDEEDILRECVYGKEYVYGELVFDYSISHEWFVRVEEWFGEQRELDEIMGR